MSFSVALAKMQILCIIYSGDTMKRIAVINDLSGFGKCSLTAALPIISAFNMQACPLPTGIYSNQTGYESYTSVDMTLYLPAFIDEWRRLQPSFDGILTGFLPNCEQGNILADFIDEFKTENTLVLADPIMGDDGTVYDGFDAARIAAVRALADKADVLTPNVTELALLCGKDCTKPYSLKELEAMSASLGKTVITTGIPLGEEIGTAVYDGNSFEVITVRRLGEHFSGTGDIFSSYVLCELLSGSTVFEAAERACAFIAKAIEETLNHTPAMPYHADGIDFERFLKIV